MAFSFRNNIPTKESKIVKSEFDLSVSEIEVILKLLSQMTFTVRDIEPLYIALYKLQEQHKQLLNER